MSRAPPGRDRGARDGSLFSESTDHPGGGGERLDSRFPNADAYQMLAYCTAFRLAEGFLVYARDAEQRSPLHHIDDGRFEIRVRAVDVERQPDVVLGQVHQLAKEIAHSAPMAAAA